jgi:hypothetical protein
VKVEHVEKRSTLDIYVQIIDQIYNQRFQKYLDYHWIQKSIIRNVTSRRFKRARYQLSHINHFHTFLPTICIAIEDVNLDWDDFVKYYKLLYATIEISKYVIAKFPNLLTFWILGLFIIIKKAYYH